MIKGKWRTTIILSLISGPKRFSQLHRLINGISAKVLSDNLQILEENHILTRTVYPTIPPTVEYCLTEQGTEFANIIENINTWAYHYTKID
jgi:DNA-binding HxlR family transcriptional regulator